MQCANTRRDKERQVKPPNYLRTTWLSKFWTGRSARIRWVGFGWVVPLLLFYWVSGNGSAPQIRRRSQWEIPDKIPTRSSLCRIQIGIADSDLNLGESHARRTTFMNSMECARQASLAIASSSVDVEACMMLRNENDSGQPFRRHLSSSGGDVSLTR